MQLSDDEILRRVQQGARAEFVQIFDRHYARIERYALRQLRDAEAARDVASETFLRAYRSVDSFRVGEQIAYLGFLFLICRRLILTERRKSQTSPITIASRADATAARQEQNAPDTAPLPLTQLLNAERRAMLREALDCIAHDDREIILLAFERDLSRQDIAQVLNKPTVSAVTSHLHRAMQKLKTALLRQGYFHAPAEQERTTE